MKKKIERLEYLQRLIADDVFELSVRQIELLKKLYSTYKGAGGNDLMLLSSFDVCKRLYSKMVNLSIEQQLDIIHEATMIAYDVRIKAFDHIIEFSPFELDKHS